MAPSKVTLPKGSLVVVSGANGYIGSHVVDQLLAEGYNVRGTIRNEKPWLNELFEKRHGKGRFETIVVPAIDVAGAFDEAVKGADGFVHVASDVSFRPEPGEVINLAVNGAKRALEASAKETSIKRFVLTSSSAATIIPTPNKTGVVLDNDSWNEAAVAAAWNKDTPAEVKPMVIYAASKTEAEKASWAFVKSEKPGFVLNTVLPNMNSGPILSPEIAGSTQGWIAALLKGDKTLLGFPPEYAIDVVDDARLHVAALLDPSVNNERIWGFAHAFNVTDIINVLRKHRPDNKLIPDPPKDDGRDLTEVKGRPRAEELLKSFFGQAGWTGFEESIVAGLDSVGV
ncbi:hypothetical protein G7046_g7982 [Stylonectria norvegica]|nr:hypothetical protein G7046_g7982 [Stylonectria norvegica]